MAKTVKEHLQESDRVESLVKDANALVKKLQSELAVTRTTLEALSEMQHPKIVMQIPYGLRGNQQNDNDTSPSGVISRQVRRINELLGDKA